MDKSAFTDLQEYVDGPVPDSPASVKTPSLALPEYKSGRPLSATYATSKRKVGVALPPAGSRPLSAGPRRPVSARFVQRPVQVGTLTNQ